MSADVERLRERDVKVISAQTLDQPGCVERRCSRERAIIRVLEKNTVALLRNHRGHRLERALKAERIHRRPD